MDNRPALVESSIHSNLDEHDTDEDYSYGHGHHYNIHYFGGDEDDDEEEGGYEGDEEDDGPRSTIATTAQKRDRQGPGNATGGGGGGGGASGDKDNGTTEEAPKRRRLTWTAKEVMDRTMYPRVDNPDDLTYEVHAPVAKHFVEKCRFVYGTEPCCRDVSLFLAKAFGMPRPPVITMTKLLLDNCGLERPVHIRAARDEQSPERMCRRFSYVHLLNRLRTLCNTHALPRSEVNIGDCFERDVYFALDGTGKVTTLVQFVPFQGHASVMQALKLVIAQHDRNEGNTDPNIPKPHTSARLLIKVDSTPANVKAAKELGEPYGGKRFGDKYDERGHLVDTQDAEHAMAGPHAARREVETRAFYYQIRSEREGGEVFLLVVPPYSPELSPAAHILDGFRGPAAFAPSPKPGDIFRQMPAEYTLSLVELARVFEDLYSDGAAFPSAKGGIEGGVPLGSPDEALLREKLRDGHKAVADLKIVKSRKGSRLCLRPKEVSAERWNKLVQLAGDRMEEVVVRPDGASHECTHPAKPHAPRLRRVWGWVPVRPFV